MSGYDILINRGVTRLCHLTLFKSLTHIISSHAGIAATNSISGDIKSVNDCERRDGQVDYVCTSVQYPNSWYLRSIAERNTDKIFRDWVILYIDPKILNERTAKFCPFNAGKGNGAYIDDNIDNIESIFANCVSGRYRTPHMPSCCPTDDQAEVLIKDGIPTRFITGIAVNDHEIAGRVYSMLRLCSRSIPIYIAPDVISVEWSQNVRSGKLPTETPYDCVMEEQTICLQ